MKIVVVGSGAREHALAWRLACGSGTSPRADREVVVVPGNPGIARFFRCRSLAGFAGRQREGVMSVIVEEQPDLVVIGPETFIDQGVVDDCQTWGIPCFGPSAAAAGLESSKAFMKEVATAAGVPTADYVVVRAAADAFAFIDAHAGRVVVKADGLAAGKGVVVCNDVDEARAEVRSFLGEGTGGPRFGHASSVVVVEARLRGEEVSVFALCDGDDAVLFGAARDHKRLKDLDQGPNTGGMGAVGPLGAAEGVSDEFLDDVRRRFFVPTLKEMKKRGTPFRGVLFAGLMVDNGVPMLLEYNVRFGDPEAEVLLAAYDEDLAPTLLAVAEGERLPRTLRFHADHKVAAVVVAAPGYPENVVKGGDVTGLYAAERQLGVQVFCAGVTRDDVGLFLVDGGRVLTVVGRARPSPKPRPAPTAPSTRSRLRACRSGATSAPPSTDRGSRPRLKRATPRDRGAFLVRSFVFGASAISAPRSGPSSSVPSRRAPRAGPTRGRGRCGRRRLAQRGCPRRGP